MDEVIRTRLDCNAIYVPGTYNVGPTYPPFPLPTILFEEGFYIKLSNKLPIFPQKRDTYTYKTHSKISNKK